MKARTAWLLPLLAVGCGSASAKVETGGANAEVDRYESNLNEAYLKTSGDGASSSVEGSLAPGKMRLKPEVCNGMKELRPEYKNLDENALVEFFKSQNIEVSKRERARGDLVYIWVPFEGKQIRLRVAVLPGAQEAGRDLHQAILEHGSGSWGVHRSNLAVLAPMGDADQIVAFAAKTKLACWGVLTLAGRDDDFVVPGGYTEL